MMRKRLNNCRVAALLLPESTDISAKDIVRGLTRVVLKS
jgi:hypothetical protein